MIILGTEEERGRFEQILEQLSRGQSPNAEPDGKGEDHIKEASKGEDFIRNFNTSPEELYNLMEPHIVKQYGAAKIIAGAVCNHLARARMLYLREKEMEKVRAEGKEVPIDNKINTVMKSNVLMIGPTGVGKTHIIRLVADILGVPMVRADATKLTEAGYVGDDVEDWIRGLVADAEGDVSLAQYGIVYIDEIDKIASSQNIIGHDVSRTGAQRALLTILEDGDVKLRPRISDPIEMMELAEKWRKTGKKPPKVINTKNILFIATGVFPGIDKIIEKNLNKNQGIGFEGELKNQKTPDELLEHVRAKDFEEYGFEAEFIGRFPRRCHLETLNKRNLNQILQLPSNPVIRGFKEEMKAWRIKRVTVSDEVKRFVADRAYEEEGANARSLKTIFEKVSEPYTFHLPKSGIGKFDLTLEMVDGSRDPMEIVAEQRKIGAIELAKDREEKGRKEEQRLAQEQAEEKRKLDEELEKYQDYISRQFSPPLKLRLTFTDDAKLILSEAQNTPPFRLCRNIFAAYERGFQMLDGYGIREFEITAATLLAPFPLMQNAITKAYTESQT